MRLRPTHRVLTIAAYGRGLVFLPFCAEVIAIDRDEHQLAYNQLTRALAMATDRFEFLELLGHMLSSPAQRRAAGIEDTRRIARGAELIATHVPADQRERAREIFLTGNLDSWQEHHGIDRVGQRVTIDAGRVARKLFPHVESDEQYNAARERIRRGACRIVKAELPEDVEGLDKEGFDRIFLDNVFTFIYTEKRTGARRWVDGCIRGLRSLLRDGDSFMVELEHSNDGFYMEHVNPRNARILGQFDSQGWRYTIFQ
ncbi:MAG TPA: hypothetical protein VJH24_06205 [Candidatus Bilamarchaeaceae archaeon]|nr:hypothetical protein [Candidatus Bilamarchaeaceae archaeon]